MDNVNPELMYVNSKKYINPELMYVNSKKYIESGHSNRSCYHFEKIEFNDSNDNDILLDIDATYVIHLENNRRIGSVREQLNKFRPTKNVFILHNKGYKKCEKDKYINKPALDLIDAFLYIFKDAQEKDYKHVLILEDDFIFNEKIKNKKVRQNIMDFIHNRNYDIYALGLLPFGQYVYDNNTNISIFDCVGTHAMIYSRKCINETLQKDRNSIQDWDAYVGTTFKKYMYNEPLCYQLFPETENYKYWGDNFLIKFRKYIIKLLKLDVQVESGYSIAYVASRAVYGLSIIFVIWLLITVFKV
jgi:hypothetical protein